MDKALFRKLVIYNLLTSGFCVFTQLLINTSLSYIVSNTVIIYTLFTGLYLMAMGLGVFWVERMQLSQDELVRIIVRNSIIAVALCNPGTLGILFMNETLHVLLRDYGIDLTLLTYIYSIILTLCVGIISGAELPLFSKIMEQNKDQSTNDLTVILVSDYFGTSLGVLLFAFILFPLMGLIFSLMLAPVPMLLAIIYIFFYLKYDLKGTDFKLLLTFFIYLILCFIFRSEILQAINAISFGFSAF